MWMSCLRKKSGSIPYFSALERTQVSAAVFAELNLFAELYSVFRGLLGDQVFVGNVDLLFARVSRQFDDLHAVAQRLRNWIHPVRRGDKITLDKSNGTSR